MQEAFLQFVWQFQYFDKASLKTTEGEMLNIIHPGVINGDSGPDFSNTKILLDNVQWFGQTEIHVLASDWQRHRHENDTAYDNVVLHVVWDEDLQIKRKDGSAIPTLVLKNKISYDLILKWENLQKNEGPIPCGQQIHEIKDLIRLSMLDKALFERLQFKANHIIQMLEQHENDWEEVTYHLLASNFGFKINSVPFQELSRVMPYKILLKHQDNLFQMESLLFGQAGLLEEKGIDDEYYLALQKEFYFLKHKYNLQPGNIPAYEWKFLRLRPANFPVIRIAQFAMLLHSVHRIFSFIKEVESPKDLYNTFNVKQSLYWQKHYHFGKPSQGKVPGLGKSSIENIIINTLAPLLAAFGISKQQQFYIDKSVEFLQGVPAEENKIIRYWNDLGVHVKNGFDSQALIQLFNNYCKLKKCLSCNIGSTLLKKVKVH